jgi:hypothetical protein
MSLFVCLLLLRADRSIFSPPALITEQKEKTQGNNANPLLGPGNRSSSDKEPRRQQ